LYLDPFDNATLEAKLYHRLDLGGESFLEVACSHNLKAFITDLILQKNALVNPSRRQACIKHVITDLGNGKRSLPVGSELICTILQNGPQIDVDMDLDSILLSRDRDDFEMRFSIVTLLCKNGAVKRTSFKTQEERIRIIIGKEDTAELSNLIRSGSKAKGSREEKTGFRPRAFLSRFQRLSSRTAR
jgi:hypothetical protein